jgi:hypothetical protein
LHSERGKTVEQVVLLVDPRGQLLSIAIETGLLASFEHAVRRGRSAPVARIAIGVVDETYSAIFVQDASTFE